VVLKLERRVPSIVAGTLVGHPADVAVRAKLLSREETGGLTLPVDATGRFELELVSKEPALLVIPSPDMAPTCIDIPLLAPGERRDLGTLRMGPGREVSGRVLTADRAAVPGVEVAVADRWAVETRVRPVTTDAQGAFRLRHLPARPCWLRFRGGGFPQHLISVAADVGDGLDVVVTPGGLVRVRVVDGAGLNPAGSYVSIRPGQDLEYDGDFDSTRFAPEVASHGSIELRMCVGSRRLRAYDRDGARSDEARVQVREGETTEVTLVLRPRPAR
jgi:hypothetical protein